MAAPDPTPIEFFEGALRGLLTEAAKRPDFRDKYLAFLVKANFELLKKLYPSKRGAPSKWNELIPNVMLWNAYELLRHSGLSGAQAHAKLATIYKLTPETLEKRLQAARKVCRKNREATIAAIKEAAEKGLLTGVQKKRA